MTVRVTSKPLRVSFTLGSHGAGWATAPLRRVTSESELFPHQTTVPGTHCSVRRTPEGGALERGGRAARPAGPRSPFRFGVLPNTGAGISGTPGLPLTPARRHSHRSRPGGRGHPTFHQAFALGDPSVTE